VELDGATISVPGEERRVKKEANRMLDLEQQANQAQALASLDDDWHLLEGERTTFAIFLLPFVRLLLGRRAELGRTMPDSKFKSGRKGRDIILGNIRIPLPSNDKFEEIDPCKIENYINASL
jgi:hypothetical protein